MEMKIASDESFDEERENRAKRFVRDVFPASMLEETFCDHLVFSIPQSSVRSLGHCFTEIENGKCSCICLVEEDGYIQFYGVLISAKERLNIEEYSFSQTTLEQIFLKFAHAEN